MLLALLLTLALAPPDEARDAVSRLAATRAAERAAAVQDIERLGESALPALGQAVESTDLELRARAAALMDTIEGRGLARPTMVTLDFRNTRLAVVAETLSQRAGVNILLEPENDPRWRAKSVTLTADEPVPLLEALDRLSRAAGIRLDPPLNPAMRQRQVFFNAQGQRRRVMTGNELIFRPDDGSIAAPSSDSGAFRVSLLGLRVNRNRSFVRTPETIGQPEATAQFTAQLQVRAEPRLTLASVDQPRLIEAFDDKRQSLLGPSSAPPTPNPMNRGLDDNMMRGAPLVLSMTYPETPGKSIARLRGTLRALVVGRHATPIVIPLSDAAGKTFGTEGTSIQVHQVRPRAPGAETLVELSLNTPGGGPGNQPAYNQFDARASLRPPPAARGQIEFHDAKGRLCQTVDLANFGMGFGAGGRMTLTIPQSDAAGPPTEARYFSATWVALDIPFEFRNVPMP